MVMRYQNNFYGKENHTNPNSDAKYTRVHEYELFWSGETGKREGRERSCSAYVLKTLLSSAPKVMMRDENLHEVAVRVKMIYRFGSETAKYSEIRTSGLKTANYPYQWMPVALYFGIG